MLTFEQIKELAELVSEQGLGGLELERSGFRLRIDGRAAPAPPATAAPASAPAAARAEEAGSARPAEPPSAGGGTARAEEKGPPEGAHVLTSPIVGTFYRAASPDADPYVEVGARVKTGQVLCIVEAMKLMNEIESDVDGEVLEIYPKNAQPVEFGEPLFAIRQD